MNRNQVYRVRKLAGSIFNKNNERRARIWEKNFILAVLRMILQEQVMWHPFCKSRTRDGPVQWDS